MTALQMNAELFRQLSIIAEDESLMAKMLKYAKKLAAKKEEMDETEYLMSSPAMAEIIRQGQEDIKNGRSDFHASRPPRPRLLETDRQQTHNEAH